jgi:hypothetical protein
MGWASFWAIFYKLIWGRCYDHNFLRFSPIFGEKNVMVKFLHNLALFLVKNANLFADFLAKIILKPQHRSLVTLIPNNNGQAPRQRQPINLSNQKNL